ncbi:response regulator [Polaromonas sp.]|nr:response regulator [Candidatus Saccharibacteria bacterium]
MSKTSVLIIEDEILLQDVYKLVLSSQGYTIYTANNGQEGIHLLNLYMPKVVLLDIFMPVMDGKEFLRNVDTALYPDTNFIVYSNLTDDGVAQEMMNLGADRVILKSTMTPQDLIGLIEEYVN